MTRRRSLEAALIGGWLLCGGVALWVQRVPRAALAERLGQGYPLILATELLALVILLGLELPAIVRATAASRPALATAAAASCLALTLTAGLAPRAHRIFFDEQLYADVAHNIVDTGMARVCNDGRVVNGRLECFEADYNKEPPGYPFLLSVMFRVLGVGERAALVVNNLATALVPLAVFVAGALLLKDPAAGAWGAVVAAILPEPLLWGNTGAAEPTAALFAVIAVASVAAVAARPTPRGLALAAVAVIVAAQIRPESVLMIPGAGLILWMLAPAEISSTRGRVAALVVAAGSLPLVAHLVLTAGQSWDAPGARFSLEYLRTNVPVNARFYVADGRFPAIAGLLAIAGASTHPSGRGRAVAVVYALVFWIVFAVFYAGSYDYGANVRYSLLSSPAVAILSGAGLSVAVRRGSRLKLSRVVTGAGLAVVLAIHFGLAVPLVRRVGDEGWAARADVAFARGAAAALPPHSFVVSQDPGMFLNWGQSAGQTAFAASRPGYVEARLREFPGGVYLHWGYWCNGVNAAQQALCQELLVRQAGPAVASHAERTYRYAMYRLVNPATAR